MDTQQQQPSKIIPYVPINEVQISSVAMLHEMMTRNNFMLPALKCRWTTLQKLI